MDLGSISSDRSWRQSWLIPIVSAGVAIRLLMFVLAGRLEPYSDESNYLYLALLWERFGFYSDAANYLWPPAFPYVLKRAIELFGPSGPTVVKLLQVGASAVVGSCTMLIAQQVIDTRAARIAGLIWCFYLPLIGFTHYLWPETFFLALLLPSLLSLLVWVRSDNGRSGSNLLLLCSGTLLGLAVLFKEVGLFLVPIFCLWIFLKSRGVFPWTRLGRVTLLLLAFMVVVTPWTLRNFEVYGRFVPVGATLGKNLFMGVNGEYKNLDYPQSVRRQIRAANRSVIKGLTGNRPDKWTASTEPNVIDRSKQNVQRGLGFAVDHPRFLARTRVKNVADWASPMSFYLRHVGLKRYHGALDIDPIRRLLIGLALLLPVGVLVGAIPGWTSVDDRSTRLLLLAVIGLFFVSGALVNASTRYRIAIEPLLIVLAAGFYSRPAKLLELAVGEKTLVAIGCLTLVVLWVLKFERAVDIREDHLVMVGRVSRQGSEGSRSGADRTLWLWNGFLALVIGLQLLSGLLSSPGSEDLQDLSQREDARQAVRALFVATNHDRPPTLDDDDIAQLLAAENAMIREWLFTTNFERIRRPTKQRKMLERLEPSTSTERARFYFEHGIRKTPWLSWQEFDAYLSDLRHD